MLLFLWLVCPVICAIIAGAKHRSVIGWFLLGLCFPVIAVIIILVLDDPSPRHTTVIVQNNVAAVAAAPPVAVSPRPSTKGGWPGGPQKVIEAQPRPKALPTLTADELRPAVLALKVLAQAGTGFDDHAVEAVMTYLEVENGNAEFSRKDAARAVSWMHDLVADDASIRAAFAELGRTVRNSAAFYEAVEQIMGPVPSERQERVFGFFRKSVSA